MLAVAVSVPRQHAHRIATVWAKLRRQNLSTVNGFLIRHELIDGSGSRLMSSSPQIRMSKSATAGSTYEVAVCGGGLVGAAFLAAVAQDSRLARCRVLLIEPRKPDTDKWHTQFHQQGRYSPRVYSISPGSRKFLQEIGAWSACERLGVKQVKRMQIWDACSDAFITFQNSTVDANHNVSYIVQHEVLESAVWDCLRRCSHSGDVKSVADSSSSATPRHSSPQNYFKSANIKFQYGQNVANVQALSRESIENNSFSSRLHMTVDESSVSENDFTRLTLENGETIDTSLLIGADGANSLVRKFMQAPEVKVDYEQQAIVATLHLSQAGTNSTAWQRFTPEGPIALLPLSEDRSNLVWSTSRASAAKLMQLSDEGFVDELNRSLFAQLGSTSSITRTITQQTQRVIDTLKPLCAGASNQFSATQQMPPAIVGIDSGSRKSVPLGVMHSSWYVKRGCVLIGDSAHRVHPLAGLGLNLGLADARLLASKLGEAVYDGQAVNDRSHLRDYETERQREVLPVMLALESLHRLYTTSFDPVVLLRSVGLSLVGAIEPLKNFIVRRASV